MMTVTDEISADVAHSRSWAAIGTTAIVVVGRPEHAPTAEHVLRDEIDRFDRACSRFRTDAELATLHSDVGRTVRVSPTLFEALEVACDVARRTGGAVDPTVGNAIAALGYDRDYDEVLAAPERARRCGARGRLLAHPPQPGESHGAHPEGCPLGPGFIGQGPHC